MVYLHIQLHHLTLLLFAKRPYTSTHLLQHPSCQYAVPILPIRFTPRCMLWGQHDLEYQMSRSTLGLNSRPQNWSA